MLARIRVNSLRLSPTFFSFFFLNHHILNWNRFLFWKFYFIDLIQIHESKSNFSVPLVIDSNDTTSSPYDEVNRFFVFVPSARVFASLNSGVRFAIRLTIEVQTLLDFGVMIGAVMFDEAALTLLEIEHGTCILEYPRFTSRPQKLLP